MVEYAGTFTPVLSNQPATELFSDSSLYNLLFLLPATFFPAVIATNKEKTRL